MSEETQKTPYKVMPSEFGLAEHQIRQHCATIRAGVPFSAIKDNPAAWTHTASRLADGDIIHVRTRDSAYYARLYVTNVHKQAAKVQVLEYVEFAKPSVEAPKEYFVEWAGRHKWRVVRSSDRTVMEHGFGSEAEASEHAAELASKIAA